LNSAFSATSTRGFAAAERWGIVQAGVAGSLAVDGFALAIGASLMLETARIGGDAGSL